jgi:hypothetical protein
MAPIHPDPTFPDGSATAQDSRSVLRAAGEGVKLSALAGGVALAGLGSACLVAILGVEATLLVASSALIAGAVLGAAARLLLDLRREAPGQPRDEA